MPDQRHALQSLCWRFHGRRREQHRLQGRGVCVSELSKPCTAVEFDVHHGANKSLPPLRQPARRLGRAHGCVHRSRQPGPQLIRAEQALKESLATEQRRRIDPGIAAGPSFHVGRRKKPLAELVGGEDERNDFPGPEVELPQGSDHELDRRLDEYRPVARVVKRVGHQEGPHRHANVVTRFPEGTADLRDLRRLRGGRDELAPELCRHEIGRPGLRKQDLQDRVSVEISGLPEHGLRAVVVRAGPIAEFPAPGIDAPAGEGTRRFLHVLLAILPLAQREELHQLAREILVGTAFPVGRAVEIDHHRRIARHGTQKLAKVAQRVAPEQLVLPVHQLRRPHLLEARDEMVVPEERHLFRQGRRRREHLGKPPRLELEGLSKDFLPRCLALLLAHIAEAPQRFERSARPLRRRRGRLRCRPSQETVGRLLAIEPAEGLDLGGACGEARAVEQVAGAVNADRHPTRACR